MNTRNRYMGLLLAGLLASGCAGAEPEDEALAADEQLEAQARADAAPVRRPVVVVAGLLQDANTVAPLAKVLRAQGLDVTVFVPPGLGLNDIHNYAALLGETVEEVRARTGAELVDLVGHSQGGVTSRLYVKTAGEDAHVHTVVSMGSPQQGTEIAALEVLLRLTGCARWLAACNQLVAGSEFLAELNGGDATPGEVRYVTIGTRLDSVTQPVFRAGVPGAENVVMQEACPFRAVGHFGLLQDAWAHQVVLSVLSGGPAKGECAARPIGGLI